MRRREPIDQIHLRADAARTVVRHVNRALPWPGDFQSSESGISVRLVYKGRVLYKTWRAEWLVLFLLPVRQNHDLGAVCTKTTARPFAGEASGVFCHPPPVLEDPLAEGTRLVVQVRLRGRGGEVALFRALTGADRTDPRVVLAVECFAFFGGESC